MKARTKLLAAAAAVFMVFTMLAACSAGYPNAQNDGMAAPTMAPAASAAATMASEASAAPEAPAADGSGSNIPVIDPGDAKAAGLKVIYTGDMVIEAKDSAAAIQDISAKAAFLGGYVSDMQYEGDRRTGFITVRIPPEKLQQFIKDMGSLGKVLDQNLYSQDVTAQYTDVKSRLTNSEAQETQLLDIMKQAKTIDDILKVRAQLNDVQQEIEQMKGQINQMDNQVGLSTLKISVQEPLKPTPTPTPTPSPTPTATPLQFMGFGEVGNKIGRGFSDSFNWTLNAASWILTALSYIIIPLAIIAAIIIVIVVVAKTSSKSRKKPN